MPACGTHRRAEGFPAGGISEYEEVRERANILIIGCGTSWHAGRRVPSKNPARIPVEVGHASESLLEPDHLRRSIQIPIRHRVSPPTRWPPAELAKANVDLSRSATGRLDPRATHAGCPTYRSGDRRKIHQSLHRTETSSPRWPCDRPARVRTERLRFHPVAETNLEALPAKSERR